MTRRRPSAEGGAIKVAASIHRESGLGIASIRIAAEGVQHFEGLRLRPWIGHESRRQQKRQSERDGSHPEVDVESRSCILARDLPLWFSLPQVTIARIS